MEALRTRGPVLALRTRPEGGAGEESVGAELIVAVPDQPGVLPATAGVLALHRLTVRAADLRTIDPAPAIGGSALLLNWRVAAEYGSLPEAARLRDDLVRALDGSLDIAVRLAEREAAYGRRRRGAPPAPPRVTVDGAGSAHATVLEVRAQDAPALLHRIGRALDAAGVWVRSAHVSTLGASVVDAFYVTGEDGAPLGEGEAAVIAEGLEGALR